MKKVLALSLSVVLILALASACASTGDVTVGQGSVTSRSTRFGDDGLLNRVQSNNVFVTATFDKDGKVITAIIDNSQATTSINPDGTVSEDTPDGPFKTKQELQNDYNMKGASGIGREWYEQANALAEWMKGKTIDEITGMKTKKVDDNHQRVPDVTDLNTTVTIDVGDYIDALKEAYDNRK